MVVDQQDEVDRIFGALADRTRRDIVVRVLREESSVSELAASYAMSFAAIQRHVAVLERARLVTKEQRGRERIVRGDVATIRSAVELLEQYEQVWRGRIDRMSDLLAQPPAERAQPSPARPASSEPTQPDSTRSPGADR
jgi:DNA-binding transcriptional ArsR family regulator